jgi:predicted metal-dependent hydrolase
MRDAAVHRRTGRHRSCDDRFVTGALQITLPFDTPAEAASAPLSRDKAPVDVAVAPTPVRLAPAPASVFIAPTGIEIAPTAIAPASVTAAPSSVALAPFYFVRHRRARRYLLRVEPDGRLRVTIPRGGSRREAEAFATRNVEWVRDQRTRLAAAAFDPSERAALRAQAAAELPARIRQLAAEHAVAGLTRVSIRNQRTRWGSCGRDGHITLNWRLVLMPPSVRDYVLIHELMHLRRMDHSSAYWRYVAQACPGYADARTWLRTNGRSLR